MPWRSEAERTPSRTVTPVALRADEGAWGGDGAAELPSEAAGAAAADLRRTAHRRAGRRMAHARGAVGCGRWAGVSTAPAVQGVQGEIRAVAGAAHGARDAHATGGASVAVIGRRVGVDVGVDLGVGIRGGVAVGVDGGISVSVSVNVSVGVGVSVAVRRIGLDAHAPAAHPPAAAAPLLAVVGSTHLPAGAADEQMTRGAFLLIGRIPADAARSRLCPHALPALPAVAVEGALGATPAVLADQTRRALPVRHARRSGWPRGGLVEAGLTEGHCPNRQHRRERRPAAPVTGGTGRRGDDHGAIMPPSSPLRARGRGRICP